jgi:ParB family transcriptional regulator, chromosome partitioning protein
MMGRLPTARCFRYAFAMTYNEISLDEIDWDDETFRISEDLDPAGVLDSLRAIGLLNPMVVLDREPRKPIVCGFRRGRALKKLGHSRIPVRILPSEETQERIRIFELALWDNLSHRQLNPLEKARVIYKLQAMCGVPDEMLIRVYLPLLGLTPHESVLQAYLALNGAQPGLRQCLADGRLTLSSVEMLSKTPDPVQVAFSSIMTKIRLSASSQRKVLGLLEDLAAMAESRLDAPLNIPEVSAILEDSRLSPFQKGDRIYEALYCVRNPRLSHAHERFHSRIQQLELPGSIRLTPHPFFETAELHVEFEASDGKRFRELSAALQKASQAPELEELFQPE